MEWALGIGAAAAGLWFSQRYAWWRPPVPSRYPRLLMYHMIRDPLPGAKFNGLRVATSQFDAQLGWLREQGWTFRTLSEVVDEWPTLQRPTVALTFDDGYADNLHNALPLLEQYDARATLYLVVERGDDDWSIKKKAHHNSGELKAEPKLTDAQVSEMLRSGRVELGSHTLSHANFARLPVDAKRRELTDSRKWLEDRFSVPVRSFAFPFGIYEPHDPELVAEAGYDNAVTTDPGIDVTTAPDRFRLRRVKISGKENMLAFRLRMKCGQRGLSK